jgi:brefeldin A-inhibited guanine nucleotide-exchange protein
MKGITNDMREQTLLDAVYSTSNPLHLSALLKAVRTTYNIFLLSRNNDNQNVAQVTMTQMVDHIFRRVKSNPNQIIAVQERVDITQQEDDDMEDEKSEELEAQEKDGEETEKKEEGEAVAEETTQSVENNNTPTTAAAPNAPHETEADSTTYQQQIIVEANMARTEMDHKLPSGKSKDNYEDFLNDTANVFQEPANTNGNALATTQNQDTT